MQNRASFYVIISVFFVLVLSGCARVRTYVVEKERVDQNLASGNSGYLVGTPKESGTLLDRKLTRKTYVTEIELGGIPGRGKKAVVDGKAMTIETTQEPANQMIIEKPMEPPLASEGKPASVTSYTVQNNDNLEKISQKVYGTSKKWKQIFEANKDQLKNPDRIYAGMVLKIPIE
jgi:nucleoid-associated protein YgaU